MIEEKILSKLDELEIYLSKFPQIVPAHLEQYLDSFEKQLAVERLLQISIELVIDISMLLMKKSQLGLPADEEDLFQKLASILPHYALYQEMKRFRNVLVHRYGKVKSNLVFLNATQKISDFYIFIKEVKEHLKSS